jgi:nitroreductase
MHPEESDRTNASERIVPDVTLRIGHFERINGSDSYSPDLDARVKQWGRKLATTGRNPRIPRILPVILERRSVRRFDLKPVERGKILACIEAARLAPSAENGQPCRYVVLDDPEKKRAFGESAFSGVYRPTRWAMNAPVLAAICVKRSAAAGWLGPLIQGTPYFWIDAGIAGEHFVLQAQSMGLGTCWIGWFDGRRAGKALGLPKTMRVAQLIAAGYPAAGGVRGPRRRLETETIVRWNAGF